MSFLEGEGFRLPPQTPSTVTVYCPLKFPPLLIDLINLFEMFKISPIFLKQTDKLVCIL